VEAAAKLVGEFLKPIDDEYNTHKQQQLRQLALINGVYAYVHVCVCMPAYMHMGRHDTMRCDAMRCESRLTVIVVPLISAVLLTLPSLSLSLSLSPSLFQARCGRRATATSAGRRATASSSAPSATHVREAKQSAALWFIHSRAGRPATQGCMVL
jgi:hypothetical protein